MKSNLRYSLKSNLCIYSQKEANTIRNNILEELNISISTWYKWMSSKKGKENKMNTDQAVIICKWLQISLDELINTDTETNNG